jgi:hypothetical protein
MLAGRVIPADRVEHRAMVAPAKEKLGLAPPEIRGQLARYLDLGEEPESIFLRRALANNFHGAVITCSNPAALKPLAELLFTQMPAVAWGSPERCLAWQQRVAELVAEEGELERHDTEPAPAIPDLIVHTDPPPPGGVVFEEPEGTFV